jgi:hypothetical protein
MLLGGETGGARAGSMMNLLHRRPVRRSLLYSGTYNISKNDRITQRLLGYMVGEDFSHMACEQCKEAVKDSSKAEPAFSECVMVPLNRPDESDDEDTGGRTRYMWNASCTNCAIKDSGNAPRCSLSFSYLGPLTPIPGPGQAIMPTHQINALTSFHEGAQSGPAFSTLPSRP